MTAQTVFTPSVFSNIAATGALFDALNDDRRLLSVRVDAACELIARGAIDGDTAVDMMVAASPFLTIEVTAPILNGRLEQLNHRTVA